MRRCGIRALWTDACNGQQLIHGVTRWEWTKDGASMPAATDGVRFLKAYLAGRR